MLIELSLTAAGTPSVAADGTEAAHADLILWLVAGGIIAAGGVIVVARGLLESGKDAQVTSVIRSWIAISLVIGLLIFCAATLLGAETNLQSILFGGLVASTGAAIAFYFSSQGANDARADVLNAITAITQGAVKPNAFSSVTPPDGQVGTSYSYPITANGSPSPTYEIVNGELPAGLTLDADGTLHGTPTAAASSTFKVIAINSAGFIVSPDLTVTIT